ncbi:MAG: hypothetical protein ACTIH2_06455 [Anaerococcus sp.]
MKKYEVEIYEDTNGYSQILDWIQELDSHPTKENQSTLKKLYYQIERLEQEGTFVGAPIVKQLTGNYGNCALFLIACFCYIRRKSIAFTAPIQEKIIKDSQKGN